MADLPGSRVTFKVNVQVLGKVTISYLAGPDGLGDVECWLDEMRGLEGYTTVISAYSLMYR